MARRKNVLVIFGKISKITSNTFYLTTDIIKHFFTLQNLSGALYSNNTLENIWGSHVILRSKLWNIKLLD